MKKLCLLSTFFIALSAGAQSHEELQTVSPERTISFEPCQTWWYDFDVNGYVCQWKGTRLTLYSSYEVDTLITKLQGKISELEDRVKSLESKL